MKNKNRVLAVVLTGSMMLATTCPVYAESKSEGAEQSAQENTNPASYTKNENVYASLAADGTASDAYVVNHFSVESSGEIVDYGKYNTVKI